MVLMHPVSSNLIEAVGYEPATKQLHVMLVEKGTFIYHEVERHVFDDLLRADSKGTFFNKNIQYAYRFDRPADR